MMWDGEPLDWFKSAVLSPHFACRQVHADRPPSAPCLSGRPRHLGWVRPTGSVRPGWRWLFSPRRLSPTALLRRPCMACMHASACHASVPPRSTALAREECTLCMACANLPCSAGSVQVRILRAADPELCCLPGACRAAASRVPRGRCALGSSAAGLQGSCTVLPNKAAAAPACPPLPSRASSGWRVASICSFSRSEHAAVTAPAV